MVWRRRSLRAAILIIFLMGIAGAFWWRLYYESGPRYGGRTVSQWLVIPDYEKRRNETQLAILYMGEAAVPSLLHNLSSGSPFGRKILVKLPRWLGGDRYLLSEHTRKSRVLDCIEALGPIGKNAGVALIDFAADPSEPLDLRRRALHVLLELGSDPTEVLIPLRRVARSAGGIIAQIARSEILGFELQRQRSREQSAQRELFDEPFGSNRLFGPNPQRGFKVDPIDPYASERNARDRDVIGFPETIRSKSNSVPTRAADVP